MTHAVKLWQAAFQGNKDSYGFHALEELQSMTERRAGNEAGVTVVTCHTGDAVWRWTEARSWAADLLEAVSGVDLATARATVPDPMVFCLEYADGLEAAVYRVNDVDCANKFGALTEPGSAPLVTPNTASTPRRDHLPADVADRYPVASHFAAEVHLIEQMMHNAQVQHPVERTLLTTGVLAALHESSYQPAASYGKTMQHGAFLAEGRRVLTPHLSIIYSAHEETGS